MLFYLLLSYIMLFDYNILIKIDKKSIKKNKENNNNLKLVDQLISKKTSIKLRFKIRIKIKI